MHVILSVSYVKIYFNFLALWIVLKGKDWDRKRKGEHYDVDALNCFVIHIAIDQSLKLNSAEIGFRLLSVSSNFQSPIVSDSR